MVNSIKCCREIQHHQYFDTIMIQRLENVIFNFQQCCFSRMKLSVCLLVLFVQVIWFQMFFYASADHLLKNLWYKGQVWYRSISFKSTLSYDVASGSEITPCNKICKPLVVYRFTGNVMTSITTLRTWWQNHNVFTQEMRFQSICHMINRI